MGAALGRFAWIVLLVALGACGGSSEPETSAAEAQGASGFSAAVPLLELDDGMTWSSLLGVVANGPELDCVAEAIQDGGLPETFLDIELMDITTGTTSWPIWYQEVLGVEVGEDHWPHEVWRCLAPRTAAAVYVTVTLEEFNLAGIPAAEFDGACIEGLPADGDFSGAVSDVMGREHSFGEDDGWEPLLGASR